MGFFETLRQSLSDPNAFHAMTVHFPVALAIVGALLLVAFAAVGFRSRGVASVVVLCFLAASAGALVARSAGHAAEEALETMQPPMTIAEHDAVESHEDAGENLWIWTIVPAAFAGLTFTKRRRLRLAFGLLALASGFAATGATVYTGHLGGRLVYHHGLGAPDRTPGREYAPEPGEAAHAEGEEHENGV
jgi:uncharacterized membrane protein